MESNKKNINQNTKISAEEFQLLEKQRIDRNQIQRSLVESGFISGTLSGIQSRLRVSVSPEEKTAIKSIYKEKESKLSGSSLDTNFKTDGLGRMSDIGYFKDNL